MTDYYQKYMLYKRKYADLKNQMKVQQGGGNDLPTKLKGGGDGDGASSATRATMPPGLRGTPPRPPSPTRAATQQRPSSSDSAEDGCYDRSALSRAFDENLELITHLFRILNNDSEGRLLQHVRNLASVLVQDDAAGAAAAGAAAQKRELWEKTNITRNEDGTITWKDDGTVAAPAPTVAVAAPAAAPAPTVAVAAPAVTAAAAPTAFGKSTEGRVCIGQCIPKSSKDRTWWDSGRLLVAQTGLCSAPHHCKVGTNASGDSVYENCDPATCRLPMDG